MNYTEIVNLALAYSDRKDAEVSGNMDSFLRVVEARANRFLRTGDMAVRTLLAMNEDSEYYTLPEDFNGLRDIEVKESQGSKSRCTLKYMSPEQMNDKAGQESNSGSQVYYTLIAGQIQVCPVQPTGYILEIVYYRRIIPLTEIAASNWLSDIHPDCYVYGLMVEISAFVKDKESTALWDMRFKEALDEIQTDDGDSRWSGTSLQTRIG